jgi:3-methyl-2-oxobutanoate hydroxymethyltransferase
MTTKTATKKLTVPDFKRLKSENQKLVMMTCYDSSFARVLNETEVDILLIGDSCAMTMHGFDSTIHATTEMIAFHTAAVARSAPGKFIVADLPFLSFRKGLVPAMDAVHTLVKAGAHAVKLEGLRGNEEMIAHVVQSGIPVMGHLGLTPQFVNAFGGMKVQAKSLEDQDLMLREAIEFERLGAFSLVLECVPSDIAAKIAAALTIPVIGLAQAKPSMDRCLCCRTCSDSRLISNRSFLSVTSTDSNSSKEPWIGSRKKFVMGNILRRKRVTDGNPEDSCRV